MEFVTTLSTGRLLLLSTMVLICASCAQTAVQQPTTNATVVSSGSAGGQPDKPIDQHMEEQTTEQFSADAARSPKRDHNTANQAGIGFSLDGPIHIPPKVHTADGTREFDIVRTDENGTVTYTPASGPITAETFVPTRTIRVTGSYYPVGIYGQPHSYATLIMRVPPGTLLPLIETSGEWLSVSTEKGVGFIRRSDAIISDTPIPSHSITG